MIAEVEVVKDAEPLATRREVAAFLKVPESTLHRWAHMNQGPPYRLVGRSARYEWADVRTWLGRQRVGGTVAA